MVAVLAWTDLVARCGSRSAAARQVREQVWVRVLRNAYIDGAHDERSPEVRAAALRLLLPHAVALSHRSALWVLGLDVLEREVLDVTVQRGRHLVPRPGVRTHIADLPDEHLVEVGGLLAVSAARAFVDLARSSTLADAVALGDCALRAGVTTPNRIEQVLTASAGLRGVVAARTALALLNGRSESLNESRLRIALHLDGLRDLDVQHDAYDVDGHVARADLHLDGVWIEYDGRRQRLERRAFVSDRRRQTAVAELGFEVRRVTSDDLFGRPFTSLGAEVRRARAIAAGRDRSGVRRGPDTLPPPRHRPLPTLAEVRRRAA